MCQCGVVENYPHLKPFISLPGNKLVSTQKTTEGGMMALEVTHEFDCDELRVRMEIVGSDTVCSKVYKRVD